MRPAAVVLALTIASPALASGPLGHAPPARMLPDADERPDGTPDELPRRLVEIDLAPTIATIGCAGSAPASAATPDPCARLGAAPGLAIGGFYRLLPNVAIGATGTFAHVGWDASRGLGAPATGASGTWWSAGLAGRAYLFAEGRFDPSIGFSFGAGALALGGTTSEGAITLTRKGFSSTADLDLPFWIDSHTRVGPDVAFTWQPGSGSERCVNGTCLDGSNVFARVPAFALRAGLSITVGLGDEL